MTYVCFNIKYPHTVVRSPATDSQSRAEAKLQSETGARAQQPATSALARKSKVALRSRRASSPAMESAVAFAPAEALQDEGTQRVLAAYHAALHAVFECYAVHGNPQRRHATFDDAQVHGHRLDRVAWLNFVQDLLIHSYRAQSRGQQAVRLAACQIFARLKSSKRVKHNTLSFDEFSACVCHLALTLTLTPSAGLADALVRIFERLGTLCETPGTRLHHAQVSASLWPTTDGAMSSPHSPRTRAQPAAGRAVAPREQPPSQRSPVPSSGSPRGRQPPGRDGFATTRHVEETLLGASTSPPRAVAKPERSPGRTRAPGFEPPYSGARPRGAPPAAARMKLSPTSRSSPRSPSPASSPRSASPGWSTPLWHDGGRRGAQPPQGTPSAGRMSLPADAAVAAGARAAAMRSSLVPQRRYSASPDAQGPRPPLGRTDAVAIAARGLERAAALARRGGAGVGGAQRAGACAPLGQALGAGASSPPRRSQRPPSPGSAGSARPHHVRPPTSPPRSDGRSASSAANSPYGARLLVSPATKCSSPRSAASTAQSTTGSPALGRGAGRGPRPSGRCAVSGAASCSPQGADNYSGARAAQLSSQVANYSELLRACGLSPAERAAKDTRASVGRANWIALTAAHRDVSTPPSARSPAVHEARAVQPGPSSASRARADSSGRGRPGAPPSAGAHAQTPPRAAQRPRVEATSPHGSVGEPMEIFHTSVSLAPPAPAGLAAAPPERTAAGVPGPGAEVSCPDSGADTPASPEHARGARAAGASREAPSAEGHADVSPGPRCARRVRARVPCAKASARVRGRGVACLAPAGLSLTRARHARVRARALQPAGILRSRARRPARRRRVEPERPARRGDGQHGRAARARACHRCGVGGGVAERAAAAPFKHAGAGGARYAAQTIALIRNGSHLHPSNGDMRHRLCRGCAALRRAQSRGQRLEARRRCAWCCARHGVCAAHRQHPPR